LKKLRASHGEQLALVLDPPSVADEGGSAAPDVRARRAIVDNDVISYRLRRARRRTIGFQIDDHGLTISAPRWVTLREIEVAIAEKQRWIRNKHREWREWREKRRLPQVVFADGGVLPYLGRRSRCGQPPKRCDALTIGR
jgi:predicted metal-dependent hydrolase